MNQSKLPPIISDCLEAFTTEEEREMFITGAITCCSSVFPSLTGIYGGDELGPNLYAMVIAPPAMGKSAIKYAKSLVNPIHHARNVHIAELKENSDSKKTTSPPRILFVPGNCSSTALNLALQRNPEGSLIVETEADVVSKALRSEHGGHTESFRLAFQHETISHLRVRDNEYVEIITPRLSVLLAGTPGQVPLLLRSTGDGLFSRFGYHVVRGRSVWKDRFTLDVSRDDILKPQAKKLFDLHQAAANKSIRFDLTDEQKVALNKLGAKWLSDSSQYGENAESIAKRMGIQHFRNCMVLTMLKQNPEELEDTLICDNNTFEYVTERTSMLFNNAIEIYQSLSTGIAFEGSINAQLLLDKLPDSYSYPHDVRSLVTEMGLSQRTSRNLHKSLFEQGLVKPDGTKNKWIKIRKDEKTDNF